MTEFIGEWAWAAHLGKALVALAFVSASLSCIFFWAGNTRLGRRALFTHIFSTLGVIALLFFLFNNHRYEFQYIWKHLDNDMPSRYLLSAFWGGQEGGFLMWMFWHNALACVLLLRPNGWQREVMTVISAIEAFLALMLLGVYFGDFQLGLDPFLLMREAPAYIGEAWTTDPDYLNMVAFQNGQGLNPLLQNYWMTIHPPTLFLGFAACSIPFAYAIAALWRRDLTGWIRPTIPWAFFAVGILGAGILMGGAWAYEALSFGGFWAWDPVENSSLVPWLVIVAAAHLLLINRNRSKPTAQFATIYLSMLSFLLVLYSTFLTKSGVLGDTSVHSFVDSGILPQLLVYVLSFVALAHIMLLRDIELRKIFIGIAVLNLVVYLTISPSLGVLLFLLTLGIATGIAFFRDFKNTEGDVAFWSREFWMFVGSLLLVISAVHITWQTSKPLFRELPGTDLDVTYHRFQLPIAVFIFLMVGVTQWLKYKKTDVATIRGRLGKSYLGAAVITGAILVFYDFGWKDFWRVVLLYSTLFAVFSNADYIVKIWKGKLDALGSPLAHVGFALTIFGAVLSTSQKQVISTNQLSSLDIADISDGEMSDEEFILLNANDTVPMGEYAVTYVGRRAAQHKDFFDVEYYSLEQRGYATGELVNYNSMVYECIGNHKAGEAFESDARVHWSLIPNPTTSQWQEAKAWKNWAAGEKLFALHPAFNGEAGGEPDTRHGLTHDLYTHVYPRDLPEADALGWPLEGKRLDMKVGSPLLLSEDEKFTFTITQLQPIRLTQSQSPGASAQPHGADDVAIEATIVIERGGSREQRVMLLHNQADAQIQSDIQYADEFLIRFQLLDADLYEQSCEINIWANNSLIPDFVVMKASIFPQINWLWLGCILMTLGSFMAVRFRIRQGHSKKPSEA